MTELLFFVGTRPEAIKVAPVILAAKDEGVDYRVVLTGQHKNTPAEILEWFGLTADKSFENDLDSNIANNLVLLINSGQHCIDLYSPKVVLAQGDTTTVLASALSCFYKKRIFAHLEAGLRTVNPYKPYPEEMHRRLVSQIASFNFAPTPSSALNLIRENIPQKNVFMSGNTVVDALLYTIEKLRNSGVDLSKRSQILVTAHRRDNFGLPMNNIAHAVTLIANQYSLDVNWVMHPNPQVQREVRANFRNPSKVNFLNSMSYPDLITEMARSLFVLSDSGGLQEECSVLGVPILILREETERPEAISAGLGFLVGNDTQLILQKVSQLIESKSMIFPGTRLFGDGKTGKRVIKAMQTHDFSAP